jgi:Protein of unknown function (DUF3293)
MSEARAVAPLYEQAIYKTLHLSFTLSTASTDTVIFRGHSYAVITAHNPRSEALSREENDARHQALKEKLQARNYRFDSSTGQSPDGSWREEGFVIFDISLQGALELGRDFEQHAILYGQGNRVALAWCESEALDWFYPKRLSDNHP